MSLRVIVFVKYFINWQFCEKPYSKYAFSGNVQMHLAIICIKNWYPSWTQKLHAPFPFETLLKRHFLLQPINFNQILGQFPIISVTDQLVSIRPLKQIRSIFCLSILRIDIYYPANIIGVSYKLQVKILA